MTLASPPTPPESASAPNVVAPEVTVPAPTPAELGPGIGTIVLRIFVVIGGIVLGLFAAEILALLLGWSGC
ncbi:MAG TPA: hypothetical protein VGM54_00615 [Chthoniobacter sp.]|jgi:hypothetical protein